MTNKSFVVEATQVLREMYDARPEDVKKRELAKYEREKIL